jgi:hypothetical protein
MKDSEGEHFEFVRRNVSTRAMNEGRYLEYAKVQQGGIEQLCVSFSFQFFSKRLINRHI